MEDYSRERHVQAGYEFVTSPHIAKEDLFNTSGHLEWFADGMFPPMELDEGTRYYLKPMNCPFHILIYQSQLRSYRDLPLRYFEFGSVYRYERSGVVHGLTRVRGMTQDDAHIFCTKEQLSGELESTLRFVLDLLSDFGLTDFYLELSTKPEGKAIGSDEDWDEGIEILRQAAAAMDLEVVLDEGGGAFYGPKISVQTRDGIGRTWQLSTIQADFQEPQRFDLSYVGADNERHQPIMIHRALFGSIERFFAILLEHYAGAFPVWLAPVQVTVLPVADRHDAYAFRLADRLRGEGYRAELIDATADSLGARGRGRRAAMSLERLWAGWRAAYVASAAMTPSTGPDDCLFCALAAAPDGESLVAARDDLAFAVMNAYPYTSGHLMIAPLRHEAELEDLKPDEATAVMTLTQQAVAALKAAYTPDGINVGVNLGRPAGAGVPGHVHLHALPRWNGDTNFMTTVAETRVLPEDLRTSWEKVRSAWPRT